MAGQLHEVSRVALVDDAEAVPQTQQGAVLAQQPVGDGVKRPGVHLPARAAPTRWPSRRTSSSAARRLNVTSSSRCGATPLSTSRASRATSVRVLPVPAPATMSNAGPSWCTAAAAPGPARAAPGRPGRAASGIDGPGVDHVSIALTVVEHTFGYAPICQPVGP